MPPKADALLVRFQAEREEREKFMDGVVETAEKEGRDLTEQELTLLTRTKERIEQINGQMEPLTEAITIAHDSRERTAQLLTAMQKARDPERPGPVEYRSAGEFIIDVWRSGLGVEQATARLDVFKRAAAHQTTPDNPGLLPEQILGPVINFVDTARPIVSVLGPRQLPSGSWSRPRVTQHTDVGKQTGEKQELVSRKMVIGKIPVAADTYGGYVNISRQNVDWSQPAIMDIVVNDLAGVYAEETEAAAAAALEAASTVGSTLPANPTGKDVGNALWAAAGAAYTAVRGAGRLVVAVSPSALGLVGPLFAPVNPQDAQSAGFVAGTFGSGAMGAISGMTVVMSPGLPDPTILVFSTAAAEVYEDRIGALQVIEPSVLGVQVAYAGYFAPLIIEPEGIIAIGTTTGP
jgi:HK97 family phage major capsid protein